MSLGFSLHTTVALAISSGLLGFLSRPAVVPQPLPPCVSRCCGVADPDEAKLGNDPAIARDIHRSLFNSDASVSWLLWGVCVGGILTIALATGWSWLIAALRWPWSRIPTRKYGVLGLWLLSCLRSGFLSIRFGVLCPVWTLRKSGFRLSRTSPSHDRLLTKC